MPNPLTQEVNIPIINKKAPLWVVAVAGVGGLFILLTGKKSGAVAEDDFSSAPSSVGEITSTTGPEVTTSGETSKTTTEETQITNPAEEISISTPEVYETYIPGDVVYTNPIYTPQAQTIQASTPAAPAAPAAQEKPSTPSAGEIKGTIYGALLKKAVTEGSIFEKPLKLTTKELKEQTITPAPVSTQAPSAATQKERAKEREKTSPALKAKAELKPLDKPTIAPAPASTKAPGAGTQKERAKEREKTSPALKTPSPKEEIKPARKPATKPATSKPAASKPANRRR